MQSFVDGRGGRLYTGCKREMGARVRHDPDHSENRGGPAAAVEHRLSVQQGGAHRRAGGEEADGAAAEGGPAGVPVHGLSTGLRQGAAHQLHALHGHGHSRLSAHDPDPLPLLPQGEPGQGGGPGGQRLSQHGLLRHPPHLRHLRHGGGLLPDHHDHHVQPFGLDLRGHRHVRPPRQPAGHREAADQPRPCGDRPGPGVLFHRAAAAADDRFPP